MKYTFLILSVIAVNCGQKNKRSTASINTVDEVSPESTDSSWPMVSDVSNEPVFIETKFGSYWQFAPSVKKDILFVIHGTVGENDSAKDTSEEFIKRWTDFSKAANMVIISPAFDYENFQKEYGGYRGLFGRKIAADKFIIDIFSTYAKHFKLETDQFYLYGHSAGGQFSNRFLVRHPEKLKAVVISAAGRFAYPSGEAKWPYGMAELNHNFKWDSDEQGTDVKITPDPVGWTKAAQVRTHLLVGSKDTEQQPSRPAHEGTTRIEFAQSWFKAMQNLSAKEGGETQFSLELVDGVGHDSRKLTPAAINFMTNILK